MNYSVEIRVDVLSGGDLIPHTFLIITGPDGERGYGFAPEKTGLIGIGHVQDDTDHPWDQSSGKMSISKDEYDKLMIYISRTNDERPLYELPLGSQCTNWALNALAYAEIIPRILGPDMGSVGLLQTLIFNPYWQATGFWLNYNIKDMMERFRDMFTVSLNQDLRRGGDPLILDLDGDGVETTGVKDGAYFDHRGDGFKEQTGWVGADDGLLVRDRNANGRIDSGLELFGDNTLLPDGTTAPNGFEALKALDDNKDGKIDSQDQAFSELRVWKDANGDGYTAAGELMTLGEAVNGFFKAA